MSQQQDPLPIEVDSSAGGWSWQIELTYPQITPHHQEALPMSVYPFLGGGGEDDEEDMISRLRSGPLLSPPRWLGPFSSASPPDISVALWDPNTWIPPCSPYHAAAALLGFHISELCGKIKDLLRSIPKKIFFLEDVFIIGYRYMRERAKRSATIRNLDDDGEEEEEEEKILLSLGIEMGPKETDNRFDVATLRAHPRDPYGLRKLLVHQFRKDGELEYCIHCNQVFASDTSLSGLRDHLLFSHRILYELLIDNTMSETCRAIVRMEGGLPSSRSQWYEKTTSRQLRIRLNKEIAAAIINDVQQCFSEEPTSASNSRRLSEGSSEGNILLSGNGKPKEIGGLWEGCYEGNILLSGNGKPKEIGGLWEGYEGNILLSGNGKPKEIGGLWEGFYEGNILLSRNGKPKEIGGLWEGCESASEAARGNGEPIEINPEKSASGHVESPLAFDQSNTLPEMMRLDDGKAVGITDAVENCFEEMGKADKPKGTSKTKRSGVWEHFVKIIIDYKVRAECNHCKRRLKADSETMGTSSLRRHLENVHGIILDKASSSKNEKNLCGGPSTYKSKTPTPSPRPPLVPVASKSPRTTMQRKKRTADGANDLGTEEVCAGGKRSRRSDNPSCGVQFTRSRKLNQEAN